jgi:hypothetical protein
MFIFNQDLFTHSKGVWQKGNMPNPIDQAHNFVCWRLKLPYANHMDI